MQTTEKVRKHSTSVVREGARAAFSELKLDRHFKPENIALVNQARTSGEYCLRPSMQTLREGLLENIFLKGASGKALERIEMFLKYDSCFKLPLAIMKTDAAHMLKSHGRKLHIAQFSRGEDSVQIVAEKDGYAAVQLLGRGGSYLNFFLLTAGCVCDVVYDLKNSNLRPDVEKFMNKWSAPEKSPFNKKIVASGLRYIQESIRILGCDVELLQKSDARLADQYLENRRDIAIVDRHNSIAPEYLNYLNVGEHEQYILKVERDRAKTSSESKRLSLTQTNVVSALHDLGVLLEMRNQQGW